MSEPGPYSPPRVVAIDRAMTQRAPLESRRSDPVRKLGGLDALGLIERFGSPLVVYDAAALTRAFEAFRSAFTSRWPRTRIAYSVKTNYLSAILALLHRAGAKMEVVSGYEHAICRRLGIRGEDICFNGPWKSSDELERAFADGSTVNFDNLDEVVRAEAIAEHVPGTHRVGIRCNMEVSYPPWDKFGFNLTSGDAIRMARRIHANERFELTTLHMHVGTYIPNPDQYEKGAAALGELALRIRDETGHEIPNLDMGGGYASTNRLRGQMLPGTSTSPTPEMYADSLTRPLLELRDRHDYEPTLVLEPGRAVVDECADVLTTVVAVKPLLGGGRAAIIDAGVNVIPTAYWYDHDVVPVTNATAPLADVKLMGPLCMQIDVVRPRVVIPAPKAGDVLLVRRVGAYNFSQSMQFIYPRPNHVLVLDGEVHVIRARETVEAALALESVPDGLQIADQTA